METFNKKILNVDFIQDNQSYSKKNILRGLHFQLKFSQAKLIRVIKGEIFDVAVDLRIHSETFGQYFSIILSEDNNKQLFIPEHFAHGFLTLSDDVIFTYKCSNYYHPEFESGIIWNDKILNINWPINENLIISNKDNKLGNFNGMVNWI